MANLDISRAPREAKIKLHGARGLRGHAQGRPARRRGARHARPSTSSRVSRPSGSTNCVLEFAIEHGAIPAPLNYRGFPKAICTSINHVVCHGIPNAKPLQGRRHRQHRRHADPRRLARRYQPHVRRRPRLAPGRAADRGHLRGADARRGGGEARATPRAISAPRSRSLPKRERCSVVRDFCGHGLGPRVPRPAQHPALWRARRRASCWSPACCSPSSR